MKRLFHILLAVIAALPAFAQEEILVEEVSKTMSKGEHNAFTVAIPEGSYKTCEKSWIKLIKEAKVKVEKEKDEYVAMGTVLEKVSAEPMNIYSRLYETGKGVQLVSFFESEGGFISTQSNAEKASTIRKMMADFGRDMYRLAVEGELKVEERGLAGLQNDLQKLINDNEKFYKNISAFERNIGKTKGDIGVKMDDVDRKNDEISMQKDVVRKLRGSDGEVKDAANQELKSYEKERKRMLKDIEGDHKKIDNMESDIRQAERDIESNLELQELKKEEISEQKQRVQAVKTKLDNI